MGYSKHALYITTPYLRNYVDTVSTLVAAGIVPFSTPIFSRTVD